MVQNSEHQGVCCNPIAWSKSLLITDSFIRWSETWPLNTSPVPGPVQAVGDTGTNPTPCWPSGSGQSER